MVKARQSLLPKRSAPSPRASLFLSRELRRIFRPNSLQNRLDKSSLRGTIAAASVCPVGTGAAFSLYFSYEQLPFPYV